MRPRMLPTALLVAAIWTVPLVAQPASKPVEPPPGGYTPEKLIEALTKLGYEPTVYGTNKDRCWVSLNRGDYRTTVAFSFTTDRTTVWFDCPLSTVAFPAQAPAKAMRALLEENERIDPAHFTYDTTEKRFHLYQAYPNRDWAPKKLRQEIEKFDDLLRKKEPIWRIDNFLRLAPVAEAVEAPERANLQGSWKLVEGVQNGTTTPPETLDKANITVTIKGDKLFAETQKLEWTFVLDPNHQPKAADFISRKDDKERVETGIYKLEGDRLTLHLAAIGSERPVNFTIPAGDKRSVLVLQRQKP